MILLHRPTFKMKQKVSIGCLKNGELKSLKNSKGWEKDTVVSKHLNI